MNERERLDYLMRIAMLNSGDNSAADRRIDELEEERKRLKEEKTK